MSQSPGMGKVLKFRRDQEFTAGGVAQSLMVALATALELVLQNSSLCSVCLLKTLSKSSERRRTRYLFSPGSLSHTVA